MTCEPGTDQMEIGQHAGHLMLAGECGSECFGDRLMVVHDEDTHGSARARSWAKLVRGQIVGNYNMLEVPEHSGVVATFGLSILQPDDWRSLSSPGLRGWPWGCEGMKKSQTSSIQSP